MSVWHNYLRNILFVRGFSSNWDYPAIEIINIRREAQIHRRLVLAFVCSGNKFAPGQTLVISPRSIAFITSCLNKTKTENSNEEWSRSALF
jgi:hypothetical protein